jgi:hypothetical protein
MTLEPARLVIRLYFDTNIYRFIRATNEIDQVAALLDTRDCMLLASSGNLFETYAITPPKERSKELSVLVTLADDYESHPESWFHALELRREIKRLRPKWLRAVSSKRRLREFLQGHRERWKEAQRGMMPGPDAYDIFRRDSERGVNNIRDTQKSLRQGLRESTGFTLYGPWGDPMPVAMDDPEVFWRLDCLQVWYNAIEIGASASRDYADWLNPYLRSGCFRDHSYPSFWLTEVNNSALPLNRLTSLIAFYQLQKKITHGNAADQIHASHWLTSDLFVTADRAFHNILTEVATKHYPYRTKPALIDRSATSALGQLQCVLSSYSTRKSQ